MTKRQINTAIKQRRFGFTWAGLARRYGVAEAELLAAVAAYHRDKLTAQARGNAVRRQRSRAKRNRTIGDLMAAGVGAASIARQCGLSVDYVIRIGRNSQKQGRAVSSDSRPGSLSRSLRPASPPVRCCSIEETA